MAVEGQTGSMGVLSVTVAALHACVLWSSSMRERWRGAGCRASWQHRSLLLSVTVAGLEEVMPSMCHWTHAVVVVIIAIFILVALVVVIIVPIVFIVITVVVVVVSPGSARWLPSTSSLLWPLPSLSV